MSCWFVAALIAQSIVIFLAVYFINAPRDGWRRKRRNTRKVNQ